MLILQFKGLKNLSNKSAFKPKTREAAELKSGSAQLIKAQTEKADQLEIQVQVQKKENQKLASEILDLKHQNSELVPEI